MKYRIWSKIEKRYLDNVYIMPNGCLMFLNSINPIECDKKYTSNYIIQRCTDLWDMDGNYIYEGDICEYYRGQHEFKLGIAREIGVIKYFGGQFVFDNEMRESPISEYVQINDNSTYLKVIGKKVTIF